MPGKRYTAEQIVAKLREAELQGQGLTIPGVCRRLQVSEQTFYRWRKLVSPTRRRDAVAFLVRRHHVSERRACTVVGQHRSTQRFVAVPGDFEQRLVKQMRQLAEAHPQWGYRRTHALLVDEGWAINQDFGIGEGDPFDVTFGP